MNATTIIRKAEEFLAIDENRKIKNEFLEKYTKCEVLCRQVIKEYLKENNEYESDEDIGMELVQIKDALN